MPNPICPIHQAELKIVPGGVSRKTGKPYSAFYTCQIRECTYKHPEAPPVDGSGGNRSVSKDNSIIRQVAFKGAIDLLVAGKIQLNQVGVYTNSFEKVIHGQAATTPESRQTQQDGSGYDKFRSAGNSMVQEKEALESIPEPSSEPEINVDDIPFS